MKPEMIWSRRQVAAGAAVLTSAFGSRGSQARDRMRVVVVGGGIGGATAARYLAMSGAPVSVTLIEPQPRYTTCIFCNLYLAGARSLPSLTHGYEALTARYGIGLRQARATAIDPQARRVRLESGDDVPYDRLVVAPGIAFAPGAIEGYDEAAMAVMPHAWGGARQMQLLRAQLEAMDDGGTFVITAPPEPYRCPAGPYERAALAAYYFKQFKPRSKVLVVDSKNTFFEKDLFEDGWRQHYKAMVEWLPASQTGGVGGVDPTTRSVRLASGSAKADVVKGDVVNVIPPQVAGVIAAAAGLVDRTGWCPVDPASFESTLQRGIHVIGDAASAGAMPKTGFCANSQAKACAFAILAELSGARNAPPHLLDAGFAFLAGDDVLRDLTPFKAVGGRLEAAPGFASTLGDKPDVRRQTVREANRWYDAFMQDVLG